MSTFNEDGREFDADGAIVIRVGLGDPNRTIAQRLTELSDAAYAAADAMAYEETNLMALEMMLEGDE